jgi:hypothetical protein
MILHEAEIQERLESPLNLLNRLKSSITPKSHPHIVSIPDSKEIIPDLDDKIKFGSAKSKAMNVMNLALDELDRKIPELKPRELANVASSMAKVIDSTQVRNENQPRQAIVIINSPALVSEDMFETIDVSEA